MSPKLFQVRLYIIRHAESEIKAASTHICGQNIPCKRLKYQNIKFDSILCSTVVRAERTAEIALKTMNIDISKLIISSELLEESQGSWEGMSRALAFTPEVIQQWNELHFEFCPPNGESKRMVQKRALAYLEPIIEQAKNKNNPKYAWLIKQNNTAINEILLNEHGISVVKVNDDSHLRFLIPEMQNESLDNL
ncbi:unnamed protein product [Rotaria sp. Silwood1]|nr:unnamed protein product [Rotaria sp. Silwood1]CAF1692570.1 unnamed protein product [Rotaria sp. Silwood1]